MRRNKKLYNKQTINECYIDNYKNFSIIYFKTINKLRIKP